MACPISLLGITVYLLAFTFASNSPTVAQPTADSSSSSISSPKAARSTDTAMAANNTQITQSINRFAAELLDRVHHAAPADANIIVSPFSVQVALGLALLGATDATFEQLRTGLQLDNLVAQSAGTAALDADAQRNAIAAAFEQQLATVAANPQLHVANKIYVQQQYHIRAAFEQLARKQFASETETLNFGASAASAATINAWVEQKTNNLIHDLIASDSLDADTRMVLVNAIHFKGQWRHQFPPAQTHKAPFWVSETESREADMMAVTEHFRFGDWSELDATAVELPYRDSDMSMLVVLPNKRAGLKELVGKLRTANLTELTKNMWSQETNVVLPKFKIEYEVKLPAVLKEMGMTNMFSDAATFGNLLEEAEPLKISDVVHKAGIEVNEEGAEAAAATGVQFQRRNMVNAFAADHPFWFTIYDANSSQIVSGIFVR